MKKILFLFLFILIVSSFIVPSTVLAATTTISPPPGMDVLDDITADDVVQIIVNARNWFAGVVVIIAVGVILFGAFAYMTAGGDDKKVDVARKILINGVIGIIVALFAYGIVSFISTLLDNLRSN